MFGDWVRLISENWRYILMSYSIVTGCWCILIRWCFLLMLSCSWSVVALSGELAIYFADDSFKRIFLNENVWFAIKISLKFVSKGLINNIPALGQIMAWRRPGDKPLSEPMLARLLTHTCVTRPQWVKLKLVEVMLSWLLDQVTISFQSINICIIHSYTPV